MIYLFYLVLYILFCLFWYFIATRLLANTNMYWAGAIVVVLIPTLPMLFMVWSIWAFGEFIKDIFRKI